MKFASPLLLALLAVVPVLLVLWLRDERSRARRLALLVDNGLLDTIAVEDDGQGVSESRTGKMYRSGRVIVVVTEGEDHEGGLEPVAKELKETGSTVVLIGVGSTLGEPIPVVDKAGHVSGYVKDR